MIYTAEPVAHEKVALRFPPGRELAHKILDQLQLIYAHVVVEGFLGAVGIRMRGCVHGSLEFFFRVAESPAYRRFLGQFWQLRGRG